MLFIKHKLKGNPIKTLAGIGAYPSGHWPWTGQQSVTDPWCHPINLNACNSKFHSLQMKYVTVFLGQTTNQYIQTHY